MERERQRERANKTIHDFNDDHKSKCTSIWIKRLQNQLKKQHTTTTTSILRNQLRVSKTEE